MIQEKNFPLRGRSPRSGNVFENHFLNQDNQGKMQLKTRKNGLSCIELEQYMKQSVFYIFLTFPMEKKLVEQWLLFHGHVTYMIFSVFGQ